jgi:D-alanyl-lipoteichoic acid acyltransferase DltB (MBOAT superfamily)
MLFNSFEYLIFLPIVFILYWKVLNKNLKLQNFFILTASYIFYGWWDWRFLTLIFVSSCFDYFIGVKLFTQENQKKRKLLLALSIFMNLGLLGFFKYFNFFVASFSDISNSFGFNVNESSLKIILPVGISFYTFQELSYTIDVYRKKLEPTKSLISFLAYVSFFPQLVAGPVERAKNLLPQFYIKRKFDVEKAKDGLRQILLGLFKKIVIADSCAPYVNDIFTNYSNYNSSTLFFGIILFAFQIYGDFSGYSDIAIGSARLFGFNIMKNFAFPYFSRGITEYWRRWHISLSTWFRDYLYIPLGGSHCSKLKQIRNIVITFTVSGLWHGANWTYIFWGFANGLLFIPGIIFKKKEQTEVVAENKFFPNLKEVLQLFITFWAINFTVVFFRSSSIKDALMYFKRMFSTNFLEIPEFVDISLLWIIILILSEWIQRKKEHAMQIDKMPRLFRWIVYYIFSIIVFYYFNQNSGQSFVYFQF